MTNFVPATNLAANRAIVIDTTAPVLAEVSPLSSPTNDGTPNYTFSSTEAGTITYGGDCSSATTSASIGNNTVTFSSLSDGVHSNCTVLVEDTAGNVSSALAVTMFTIDTAAPDILSLSPADDAMDVSPTADLVIAFDEVVVPESGNITIFTASGDTQFEQINLSGGQVTGGGTTTITINPSFTLDESTSYYVQIDATAFDDSAGNSFPGISDETTWNFTTGKADVAPVSSATSSSSSAVISGGGRRGSMIEIRKSQDAQSSARHDNPSVAPTAKLSSLSRLLSGVYERLTQRVEGRVRRSPEVKQMLDRMLERLMQRILGILAAQQ